MARYDQEQRRQLIAFGRGVRELCAERNISASELAAAAGLTPRRLEAIEAGRLDPPYDVMLGLAAGLDITLTALVSRAAELRATIGTLQADGVLLHWTIDAEADAAVITFTPANVLDQKALEDATIAVERILDQQVASGASASANLQTGCIEGDIALDGITAAELARKLMSLEGGDA
jgi:transcriptional regulator with XRE-family HTH domain